jgi:transposase
MVLLWPENSPDLNPIENLWQIIKTRLEKMDCTTVAKLISYVFKLWNKDEKIAENCRTLVDSMPKRIHEVITNRGGHISY